MSVKQTDKAWNIKDGRKEAFEEGRGKVKQRVRKVDEYAITPTVAAITDLNFIGNIIPQDWWQADRLRLDTGKPNALAILILSDICYWYRAIEERDDARGTVLRLRRRFKADKLQKSYSAWADQFGFSKRQVQRAIAFLIERGLIRRELRTVSAKGMTLSNVTFFEPVVNILKEITCVHPIANFGDTPSQERREVSLKLVRPPAKKGETCTETTSETTSENTQRESGATSLPPTRALDSSSVTKDHPAIKFVRSMIGQFPEKVLWPEITEVLGAEFDANRLSKCYSTWVGRGFNKMNFAWLLEWYVNDVPSTGGRSLCHTSNAGAGRNPCR